MGFHTGRYVLRQQDDFAIIQQFNQLYMKVRAWSIEFLGGITDSEPPIIVQKRLSRTVFAGSSHDLRKVLKNKTLHRHAVESLVGAAISEMLNLPEEVDLDDLVNTLYEMVIGFAVPRTPSNHGQLKLELRNILEVAWRLSTTCKLQKSAIFVVSYPKVVPRQKPVFNPGFMEDKNRSGYSDWGDRDVGMLLFPGVFKVAYGVRTCMVKIKVVCTDEITR